MGVVEALNLNPKEEHTPTQFVSFYKYFFSLKPKRHCDFYE